MARYYNSARFLEGDRVTHADGREGVIVLSYPRARDRQQFPIVRVLNGQGPNEWPSRGWTVELNRGSGTRLICTECERKFQADRDVSLCAQCLRKQREDVAIREQLEQASGTTNTDRDALRRPWRLRERIKAPDSTTSTDTKTAEELADDAGCPF